MADIRALRNSTYRKIKEKFENSGLFLAQIGRDFDRASANIDAATGSWADKGLHSKTPGLLIQFKIDNNGNLVAGNFVNNPTTGRLGYVNTANSKKAIGGVTVRILPVFMNSTGQFLDIPEWEWSLILIFEHVLIGGSSSDTLNKLFPPNNSIEWKFNQNTKNVNIIGASLLGLINPTDQFTYTDGSRQISIQYSDATSALNKFLTFDI